MTAILNWSWARFWQMSWVTCTVLGLCGCGSIGQYNRETNSFDATGAFQITDRNVVEPVDLGFLLLRYAPAQYPSDGVCSKTVDNTPSWARGGVANDEELDGGEFASRDRARLDRSALYFACQAQRASEEQRRQARNALQERMLLASEQRCTAFKIGLQRSFSRTNFGLGVLTTVAGTAGALVNSISAARNWAGAAAMASGTRAEYNQDFFSNLAAHVVIEGVDKRRRDVYDQIQRSGQAKAYADYPVEAAIKDALYYHGQCSVAAGLQQAADAIRLYDDPGINTSLTALAKLKSANKLMLDTTMAPDALLKQVQLLTQQSAKLAGSRLDADMHDAATDPLVALNTAFADVDFTVKGMQSAIQHFKDKRPTTAPSEDDLGIQPTRVNANGFNMPFIQACRASTTASVAHQLAQTAAAVTESDVALRSSLLVDAAKARKQAELVAEQAIKVAAVFGVKADEAVAAWREGFAKAVDTKNSQAAEAAAALKEAIGKAPKVDTLVDFAGLKKLCSPS